MPRPLPLALLAGLLTSGCVIVPVTTESFDPECRVVTRHMELKSVQLAQFQACQNVGCQVDVIAVVGLVAVSAVVSGSIVLVGNVVYWSEHRASCPPLVAGPAASAAAETPSKSPSPS
jgi:hypothetical protein